MYIIMPHLGIMHMHEKDRNTYTATMAMTIYYIIVTEFEQRITSRIRRYNIICVHHNMSLYNAHTIYIV